jgi:HlyD family secretion protein
VGATGTLQAVTTVQVGTQVSGIVQDLYADFNTLAKKGQVIARLDPSTIQTQIEQARANLVRAQADLERFKVATDDANTKLRRARELSARQLIPATDLETAEVTARAAEAQIRSAEASISQSQASVRQNEVNLEHTVITAPIDGLVISRNVDRGQTVAASMQAPTLFVLAADLTKMQVVANLDESDVGRIRPGQVVRFHVDAYPTEEFSGKVTQVRLQPIIQQNVVTYATVIDVPNPELKLKPGMTANVNVEIARRTNVVRVPNAALRFRPTNEIFAALGQAPPENLQRGDFGGRGRGNGGVPAPTGNPSTADRPRLRQLVVNAEDAVPTRIDQKPLIQPAGRRGPTALPAARGCRGAASHPKASRFGRGGQSAIPERADASNVCAGGPIRRRGTAWPDGDDAASQSLDVPVTEQSPGHDDRALFGPPVTETRPDLVVV